MTKRTVVLSICGWSGSGKTTVVHGVLGHLRERRLQVAVVKHDLHGLNIDHPGKDSDRFFRAGADVLLQGPDEDVLRLHGSAGKAWGVMLEALPREYDVVLVEGHKSMPLPKVWLLSNGETEPPSGLENLLAVLPPDADRIEQVLSLIQTQLSEESSKKQPLR